MTVVWRLALILFGFAAATLTAAFIDVSSAAAQIHRTLVAQRPIFHVIGHAHERTRNPRRPRALRLPPKNWPPPMRHRPRPRRAGQNLYSDPDFDDQSDDRGADIADQETNDPTNSASGDPADGEPSAPQDGLVTEDGVIDLSEPQSPSDGDDPNRDTRPAEDVDVFANPPAGYDPLLYQVEDVDPIEDRRPARLARFEPYDPVGIKIGSFVFFPELEIGGIWTNNVLSSPVRRFRRCRRDRLHLALRVELVAPCARTARHHVLDFL